MNKRCHNKKDPAWPRYGGRGITVCVRWMGRNGFRNFIADMGPCTVPNGTVERKKNAEGYSPKNCAWATRKTQNRNKRNNRLITYDSRTQCLAAWSEEYGLKSGVLYYRIVTAGWPIERALTEPSRAN